MNGTNSAIKNNRIQYKYKYTEMKWNMNEYQARKKNLHYNVTWFMCNNVGEMKSKQIVSDFEGQCFHILVIPSTKLE